MRLSTLFRCLHGSSLARRTWPVVASVVAFLVCAQLATAGVGQPATVICTIADGLPCRAASTRPREITLGADGRTVAIQLLWSRWGSTTATAHGTWRSNEAPDTAPPVYIRTPIALTAANRGRCGARYVYRTLVVHA